MDLTPEVDKLKVEVSRNNENITVWKPSRPLKTVGSSAPRSTPAPKRRRKLQVVSGDRVFLRCATRPSKTPFPVIPSREGHGLRPPADRRLREDRGDAFLRTDSGGAPSRLPFPARRDPRSVRFCLRNAAHGRGGRSRCGQGQPVHHHGQNCRRGRKRQPGSHS